MAEEINLKIEAPTAQIEQQRLQIEALSTCPQSNYEAGEEAFRLRLSFGTAPSFDAWNIRAGWSYVDSGCRIPSGFV